MTSAGERMPAPGGASRPIIVLLGAAGAGKGTQARILSAELGLLHLATGELFRQAVRDGTPVGRQARTYMDRGDLVPDAITIQVVALALASPAADPGAILDGFPRTTEQAVALDAILADQGRGISGVVVIEVPVGDLVARLSGRWTCPTCGTPYHLPDHPPHRLGVCDREGTSLAQREDDRPEIVRARLARQLGPMEAVVDHYARSRGVIRIDGSQPIAAVTDALRAAIRGPAAAA